MYSTREISPDAIWKPARNKGKHTERQCTETSGSTRECDWVVGLQILTHGQTGNCTNTGRAITPFMFNKEDYRVSPLPPLFHVS